MLKEKEILLEILRGLIPIWNPAKKLIALIHNWEFDIELLIELFSAIEKEAK